MDIHWLCGKNGLQEWEVPEDMDRVQICIRWASEVWLEGFLFKVAEGLAKAVARNDISSETAVGHSDIENLVSIPPLENIIAKALRIGVNDRFKLGYLRLRKELLHRRASLSMELVVFCCKCVHCVPVLVSATPIPKGNVFL